MPPATAPVPALERLTSLDAFRGCVIVTMHRQRAAGTRFDGGQHAGRHPAGPARSCAARLRHGQRIRFMAWFARPAVECAAVTALMLLFTALATRYGLKLKI